MQTRSDHLLFSTSSFFKTNLEKLKSTFKIISKICSVIIRQNLRKLKCSFIKLLLIKRIMQKKDNFNKKKRVLKFI
jgi:hypothetical protein